MTPEEKRAKNAAYARAWQLRNLDKVRAYYAANREKYLAKAKVRYAEKGEEIRAYQLQYGKVNRVEIAEKTAKKYRENLEANQEASRIRGAIARAAELPEAKEKRLARGRANHHANRDKRLLQKSAWASANPHKGAGYARKRHAMKRQAVPKWADLWFIDEAYDIAAVRSTVTGIPWEVDHIVPLISPIVCGLHVIDNLRVIPRTQNRAKGNRQWPDMPD